MIFNRVRQHFYTLFGLFLGLFFGSLLMPVLEETCSPGRFQPPNPIEKDGLTLEDYAPKINLAAKPLKAQKMPQKFLRPRYYSTELGIRKKLFVAVLSTQQTINTKGVCMNRTIAHLVDKLMFFIDAPGMQKLNVSYLKLPGIVGFFDTQVILKPFHVLKYIKDNFIEDYDFFFIVNDSAYIKARKLVEIVNGISISQNVYASGAKVRNSKICSLNSGVLFSNSVIQSMIQNIDWCVKNVRSSSDDDNFGHCALRSANVPCQQMVQGKEFTSFVLEDDRKLDINMLESMKNALTVYPVKNSDTYYLLHAYFAEIKLRKINTNIEFLRESVLRTAPLTPDGIKSVVWPIGNQPESQPVTRFDVLRWNYFNKTHIYLTNEFDNLRRLNAVEEEDIGIIINATVETIRKKYNGLYAYSSLVNGYRKFDASRGMDYILDMNFRNVLTNVFVSKRFQISKPLSQVEMLMVPYVTENRRINILLPVRVNDRERVIQFLQQYRTECLAKKEKIFLMMIFIYDYNAPGKGTKDDVFKYLKNKALSLTKIYQKDDNRVAWLSIKLPFSTNQVMEEALLKFAIVDLSLKKFTSDSLILLASPYMEIRIEYLNRVRMNTISGWQIFSPIPFTEYNPFLHGFKEEKIEVNKRHGRFNLFNTEHISFYAKDYHRARQKSEIIVPPVRSDSDMRLLRESEKNRDDFTTLALHTVYGLFVRFGDTHVIRSVEPALRIKYHETNCSPFENDINDIVTKLHENCIQNRNWNLGSRSQLSKLLLEYQEAIHVNLTF